MTEHTRVAPSASALRELIQSHNITIVDATPDEDGEYLLTPRVIRQIGFGRNPFIPAPTVEDPRVVGVAEYLPPGTLRSDGEPSRHWAAVLTRADGLSAYLFITCLRDATDPLFEHLNEAEKAQLAAPFGQEAA